MVVESSPRTRARRVFTGALVLGLAACVPPTPTIDGVRGAPEGPSTPWVVPAAARTPPPPATPPQAPAVTAALRRDSVAVGETVQLTLSDILDLALRNNPATRESWATAQAAADQYGAARGTLLPTISGNVTFSRTTSGVSAFGTTVGGTGLDTSQTRTGLGASAATTTRAQLTPALSLSYLVFDLGGRAGTIASAREQAIALDLSHNMTIQDVALETESALFSYLATRALRDAQVVAVHEAETDTAAAEARMRVGVGTLQEVLQARTELAQARLQLATLAGNLVSARGNLASAMGVQANARFGVPEITEPDSIARVSASVDTMINRAIVLRPDLAAARADAEALAAQVRVARSAGYPALTLSSTASLPRQLQGGTTANATRNYSLVLGLQIPIFNGFSREYDVKSAREQYQAGLARVQSTAQLVSVQVYTSYAALQTAVDRVAAAAELLRSAQQSSDVAVGRYREGVGTIVDLVLARTALASARASEIQARWEWRTALAQLAHDVGSLDRQGRVNVPLVPAPIRR